MAERSIVSRIVLPTMAAAVSTSAIAIVVNYATAWKNNLWAWLAVGVLTLISAGMSLWLYHHQANTTSAAPVSHTNDANFGRNSQLGTVKQVAHHRNRFKTGAKTHIDSLEMRAGVEDPRETKKP